MQKLIFTLIALMSISCLTAQNLKITNPYKKDQTTKKDMSDKTEEEQVVGVVEDLFNAMREANQEKARALFTTDANLVSTSLDENKNPVISTIPIADFVNNIGQLQAGLVDEQIFNTEVRIDDHLATVWTDYNLYVRENFSHCGVDAFQLFKGTDGWKIFHVSDTRRTDDCNQEMKSPIDQLLDDWHQAASVADEVAYFGAIADDGIFMGTDATEVWDKSTFQSKTAQSFNNQSAWNFKPVSRTVTMYEDGNLAWFEETLDTWMGPCRGSGVVALTDDGWKIKQYNLAALVPNDKMDDYRKLIGKQ